MKNCCQTELVSMTNRYYIGSNYGHSSSLAIIDKDGRIVFAAEEERFNYIKGSDAFPECALNEAVSMYPEIHGWSEGWDVYKRLAYKGILLSLLHGIKHPEYIKKRLLKESKRFLLWFYNKRKWEKGLNLKVEYVGHHLSHALSLLSWGLSYNALVLVSDTTGENESISLFIYTKEGMKLIRCSRFPSSIGSLFHQMAYHLGFSGRTGPGKLMALSGYGEPIWYKQLRELIVISNGELSINESKYPCHKISGSWHEYALKYCLDRDFKKELIGCHLKKEKGKDLAASIQKLFEEVTYELICQGIRIVNKDNDVKVNEIGLAGGAALNCQANGRIKRRLYTENNIENFKVSPWSEDGGTAIGAAVSHFLSKHPDRTIKKLNSSFLGTTCFSSNIIISSNDFIADVVSRLLNSEVIAIVDDKMEFGPRALGARCIIARVDDIELKRTLNEIKGRPSFMPFAPAILEDDYQSFFSDDGSSNMAWTVPFTQKGKQLLSGSWHPSNEARVQIVSKDSRSNLLYRVLLEMRKKTGVGAVLLTSLNAKNEVIARTLEDAKTVCTKLGIKTIISMHGYINV